MIVTPEHFTETRQDGEPTSELSLSEYLRLQQITIELLKQTLNQRELEIDRLNQLLTNMAIIIQQPNMSEVQRAVVLQLIDNALSDG